MSNRERENLPLVYACSGCSNIAQLANQVAIEMDRENIAEMSCIAGVGGGVKPLVKKAKSGRNIIALDGCHLGCVSNCLAGCDVEPTQHYVLTDYGVKKEYQVDFTASDVDRVKHLVVQALSVVDIAEQTVNVDA